MFILVKPQMSPHANTRDLYSKNGAAEKIWTSTPYQNSDLNAARLPFRHDRKS